MAPAKRAPALIAILLILSTACVTPPPVDREKAGYLAGIRFLETHPGAKASYSIKDPGGEAYLVTFNITSGSEDEGFAEYYVDKFTRDVYVSSRYAVLLALRESDSLRQLFQRYPNAKTSGELLKAGKQGERRYVWEIRVVGDGHELAVFGFDAKEEKLLAEKIKSNYLLTMRTG